MNKIVFITGATSGFGEACAYTFAQNGFDLILNGRRADRLEALKAGLESKYGSSCQLLPFDVRNRQAAFDSFNNLPDAWKQVDVLIKNSNPNLRSNPFSKLIPKPNWNITYNGLSRLKGMEKIFTNFTIRHGYSSTLSMNSFTTALLFADPLHVGMPYFRDPQTGNFIPYFLVPNITISEQFSPLIAADVTFVNQLSARFEYKKSRQLSLSLIDYQLAENHSTEYTIGMDWRKRGFPLLQNLKIGKNGKKLNNDVTFRFDFSLRDDATANSKLDQDLSYGTSGQKVVRLAPSIDYVVNNRVNLKFYFEQNRSIPKIATTAPITTTRAGLQVRISLAQ